MKNIIIICPYSLKNELLNLYRKDNIFVNTKCLSKEELLNDKFGHYSKGAIPFIMQKEKCSYEKARGILKYARFVTKDYENKKLHYLYLLREELVKNKLLFLNPYYNNLLIDKEIHIYGYSSKDRELLSCLNGNECIFHFNQAISSSGIINKFTTLDDEILYMLNSICELIDNGIDVHKIYVYCNDELALYYLEKYQDSFGIKFNFEDGEKIFSMGIITDFLNKYKQTKDLNLSLEIFKENETSINDAAVKLIKEYTFDSLSFEQQFDVLKNIFKSKVIVPFKYNNGINIISEPIAVDDAHIFVPAFIQGKFPISYKDVEFLNDDQLNLLNLNSSYIKGLIFDDIYTSFFSSKSNFYFSYSDHSFKEIYYESPWKKKFNLKEIPSILPNNIYSNEMRLYLYGKAKDKNYIYKECSLELVSLNDEYSNELYRNFDNVFKGVSAYNFDSEICYSYSSVKTYYACPFCYYLDNVLKLNPFESNFATKKGILAHNVFQNMRKENFDFDSYFDEEVKKETWTSKERILLKNFKSQIKNAYDAILLHEDNFCEKHKTYPEKKITIKIGENSFLTGKIDKAIIIDDKYLFLVDYKTGSESFDPKYLSYGYSMQLPTYAYLASQDKEFGNYDLCGMYINNVTDSSLKQTIKDDGFIYDYLKLNGRTIDDVEIIKKIDSTIESGKAKFINGITLTSGGISKKSKISNRNEFDNFVNVVATLYEQANNMIKSNNFDIHPKYISSTDNACKFCKYFDICYKKPDQFEKICLDEESQEDNLNENN